MLIELITKNAGQTQQKSWPYYPRPSSVGHCIRALVYHALGVKPDKFPDRTILVFDDGNWHEELLKDHIRKTVFALTEWKGKNQRIEIATINGRKMTGEIDGLITDPLNVTRLLEIKSINHFGFERLKDEPLDDHRRQTNLYLHGLKKASMEINEAIIIYKNKNTAAMKEFIIKYDAQQALDDITKFEVVDELAEDNEIPARPYSADSWQCSYCRWREHCWSGYVDEIAALSTDVGLSEEIETAARYFNELRGQESDIKKEREKIKTNVLLPALRAASARSGKAGEYIISLSVSEREEINRELVPPEAITTKISERFTVKRLKAKENR